jgi:serine/threonine-protein kinase
MNDLTQPMFAGGEVLAGKYRVERVIGSGGMGVVLAARHEGLNTLVAIKLLRHAALNHTDIVGRFMREARAAVSLKSEHVARVYDVGTLEDGRPYIVMERLEGNDLGEICENRVLPPVPEAVDYVMQACEAIAEAHVAGIVHRDLKPKNLFLTRTVHGRPLVKVLDFGISKVQAQQPGEMQLTKTTEIIGSPSYMSPEQLRSARNVDHRTDIWALGIILYELLTGRVPFNAETVTELVLVVVTERYAPIRSIRPDVPEGLEMVVARCLEKNPDHRFQSVVDLVAALEPFVHLVHTSPTERIRAVAQQSARGGNTTGPVTPRASYASAPNYQLSTPRPMSGGTSVAWGETQSAVQTAPGAPVITQSAAQPKGPPVALIIGLLAAFAVIGVGGIGAYFWNKSHQASTVTPPPSATVLVAAAKESATPLPPGRKDLPPSTAPIPEPTLPVPAPSTLPEDRKPTPAPLPQPIPQPIGQPIAKPAPAPKPAPKPDDLDGIGRR